MPAAPPKPVAGVTPGAAVPIHAHHPFLQKASASGLHFFLGLMILLPVVALIRHQYYPGPLFWTDGGWQGLRIALAVDLVLGPLLTFIVFRQSKTRAALTLDFSVIGLLQVLALTWGLYTIGTNRPWVLAHRGTEMYALTRKTFDDQQLPPQPWQTFGEGPPYRVAVHSPSTREEVLGAGMFEVTSGLQPFELYFLYRPFGPAALPPATPGSAPARDHRLAEAIAQAGGASRARIVRLNGAFRPAYVVFDPEGHMTGWALLRENAL